ncbi:NAD(P)H-binding protein [Vibrio sp. S4M6]|uniref:NAD(P)H-binding protein n=1 Tax=Vibrio sinus TaxID=2946865 RepID=UPI00202A5719|nr:NAD(P)H-binding protein [Vibrio sinus]MCL9782073.1 NAD(P)H-binding protein [Vibrio sinus]
MATYTILGAGWLGKPLALHLQALGHSVFASKTTPQGVEELNQSGLNGFQFELKSNDTSLVEILNTQKTDILIVAFPPGLRSDSQGKDYAEKWLTLVKQTTQTSVQRIVMVSSTSVYPNVAQECVEEDASLAVAQDNPLFTDGAKKILLAEQHLIDSGIHYSIIRCSGLMGPNRHPARFVRYLKTVSQSAPANMIHLDDVIGSIEFIVNISGSLLVNATSPDTLNKAAFYRHALQTSGAEYSLPKVIDAPDKKISSAKLEKLGYQFKYQHIIEGLDAIAYDN